MHDQQLKDALIGLLNYDTGATDAGVKNELLREAAIKQLRDMSDDEFRFWMSRFVREEFLAEPKLHAGYGVEDVLGFALWMSSFMDIDL